MRVVDFDVLLNDIKNASVIKCNNHLTGYIDAVEIIENQTVFEITKGEKSIYEVKRYGKLKE